MAEEERAELVVHGRDGKIRERNDFSHKPSPAHAKSPAR
jgi:hypothetical protein